MRHSKPYIKYLLGALVLIPLVGIIIAVMFGNTQFYEQTTILYTLHSILTTAIIWGGCFSIVTFLWKKFPWERNPIKHLIIEVLAILALVMMYGFVLHVVLSKYQYIPYPDPKNGNMRLSISLTLLVTYLITAIHEAVFFYQQWKINFSKSAKLEKDNMVAKYETLKSQINPHFLFNSLNSLSLIVDENKEATKYINNLSEFLRYVLKSKDKELVLVRDEVEVLEKYIALQKSRFRENLIINIAVDEKYYHYALPPLVLQMLIENCIKHNIISKKKPLNIDITASKAKLTICNNLQKKYTEPSTKQGLRNITDRFAFFSSIEVKIEESKNEFKVTIPLLTVEL